LGRFRLTLSNHRQRSPTFLSPCCSLSIQEIYLFRMPRHLVDFNIYGASHPARFCCWLFAPCCTASYHSSSPPCALVLSPLSAYTPSTLFTHYYCGRLLSLLRSVVSLWMIGLVAVITMPKNPHTRLIQVLVPCSSTFTSDLLYSLIPLTLRRLGGGGLVVALYI